MQDFIKRVFGIDKIEEEAKSARQAVEEMSAKVQKKLLQKRKNPGLLY